LAQVILAQTAFRDNRLAVPAPTMKFAFVSVCLLHALGGASASQEAASTMDRTITRVVKQLQEMLDTSKAEGDAERKAYAKFMCECDTQKTEKTETVKTSETKISLLESSIEELQGSNGVLSEQSAKLKADMAQNRADLQEAQSIRDNSNDDYKAEKKDLEAAIGQLNDAIGTLASVSADQSDSDGAMDNKKFMAGFTPSASLLRVSSSMKSALNAAAAFAMDAEKKKVVTAFAQAPFTGSYTSQSVEVMGILKNMRDTFKSNLDAANTKEAAEVETFTKLKTTLDAEFDEMKAAFEKKERQLSENDDDLSEKRDLLSSAKSAKSQAEDFLAQLIPTCADKDAEYKKRNALRVDEEMAISEAISILDSDASFATFGTVSATSTGSTGFLQLASIREHSAERAVKDEVVAQLQEVKGSPRLSKMASLVQTNPFTVVLKEIEDMLTVIAEEQVSDKEKLDFCNSERTAKDKDISDMDGKIDELAGEIQAADTSINDPTTGLLVQIAETESTLKSNKESQADATTTFEATTLAYKKDVKNLEEAESILTEALTVLKAYYAKLDKALEVGLLQKGTSHKQMPTGAEMNMKGQSEKGNSAMQMLEYIKAETIKERETATQDFNSDEMSYKSTMESLKEQETTMEGNLAELTSTLASTQKSKMSKEQDKAATEKDKAAVEAYLADIKPGCDFITTNFNLRTTNRSKEKEALTKAITLVKQTPAYVNAKAVAHLEGFGDCKAKCEGAEGSLSCKACMADVTEVAYCAGHPKQPGCSS